MLSFFVPMLMLFIAPVIQIVYSVKRINGSTKLSLASIAGSTLILGLILSIAGVVVSMWLLPSDIRCATACIGFAPLGLMILCITTPITFFISLNRYRSKQKMIANQ